MYVKAQGFSFDWMNSNASIALCTLVSRRRQNLRLQNTVCVLVWRVLLDFVGCLLSPFVAYGREHVEY